MSIELASGKGRIWKFLLVSYFCDRRFFLDTFSCQNHTLAKDNRLDGAEHSDSHVPQRHFLSLYQWSDRKMGFGYPCRFRVDRFLGGLFDDRREFRRLHTHHLCF